MSSSKDHEGLHFFLTLLALVGVFGSQFFLVYWKKHYYPSFQQVSLVGLWLFPLIMSFISSFFRFISIWVVYTILTLYIIYLAHEKPLRKTTPRNVYIWFTLVYRISYNMAVLGYTFIICELLGIFPFIRSSSLFMNEPSPLTPPSPSALSSIETNATSSFFAQETILGFSTLMIFYGLYFGVLSRDCAEVCTNKIASRMALKSEEGLPNKVALRDFCGICNLSIDSNVEETFELPCQHIFHEFCISGWRIIGKKNTCPYCSEKVDLKSLTNPIWTSRSQVWYHLLDALRYLIVWNPIIIFVITTVMHLMDREHH